MRVQGLPTDTLLGVALSSRPVALTRSESAMWRKTEILVLKQRDRHILCIGHGDFDRSAFCNDEEDEDVRESL